MRVACHARLTSSPWLVSQELEGVVLLALVSTRSPLALDLTPPRKGALESSSGCHKARCCIADATTPAKGSPGIGLATGNPRVSQHSRERQGSLAHVA
jgi:hypothetical protein